MGSQPLGKVGNGCLCTGVSRDLGQRNVGIHGGDIQNIAGLLGHHVLCKDLGGQQSTLEVQLEQEVNTGLIQIKEGLTAIPCFMMVLIVTGCAGIVAAGTVDQDITGTQVIQDLLMDSLQSFQFQNITLITLHHKAFCADIGSQLQNSFFIQIQRRNLCACLCISTGHITAQDTTGTGNNNDLTGKIMGQSQIEHSS